MAQPETTTRLVCRGHELMVLEAFIRQAADSGATFLLSGEPGVGKTALMAAAVDRASAASTRVLRGSGVEYESDVSFVGLHQPVDPLSDELRRLPSPRSTREVALGIGPGPTPTGSRS